MRRISFCIILTLCLCSSLFAIDFEGLAFADYYGNIEPSTSFDHMRARVYYQPTFAGSMFDYALDYEISANFYYDMYSDLNLIPWENIIREAYVSVPLENFDLTLGQKTVSPGLADIFSPLNCVNGEYVTKLSLDDPYESRRGDVMLQVAYYPNYDDSIELIYVPFPRPDYEPSGMVSIEDTYVDIDVDFDNEPYMFSSPHSLFLSYYHYGLEYDLQLSYAYYTDQTPGFDLSGLTMDGADLKGLIETIYTRNHTIGGAYSMNIGEIAWTEELALNITEDFAGTDIGIRNSDITLDTQILGTLWGGTMAQLNIVYQYIFNFDKGSTDYSPEIEDILRRELNGYFNQPLQHVAFAILHLQNSLFHDRLAVSINAGYLHPAVYLAPRVSFAITDGLRLEAGADIKTGVPTSADLARGNLDDNYYVRVKYAY